MHSFNPEQAMWEVRREFGEHGGVTPSISRSSTFTVMDPKTMPEIFEGIRGPDKNGCFLYSRHFNPTVNVLSRYLAAMEGTEAAMCTASGMAAISCTLLQLCPSGGHIVASDTVYGGTHALLGELLPRMGISTTFVDPSDSNAFREAMTPETRVLYTETFANPTLKIADIPSLSRLARDNGSTLVVDNTFSPMIVSPAVLGAHIVVHSMTKFISGYGGILTIDCQTSEKAEMLLETLQNKERYGLIAVSLGYFDTLMSCSSSSTSSEIPPEDQHKMGLSPGLVRLSIGLTGSLTARLEQLMRAVKTVGLVN